MAKTKSRGWPMFADTQELVLAITQWLNTHKTSTEYHYLHLELREADTDEVVGTWSDEIADDAWSFTQVEQVDEELK